MYSDNLFCLICYFEFIEEKYYSFECEHIFCKDCLTSLLFQRPIEMKSNGRCPVDLKYSSNIKINDCENSRIILELFRVVI